MMFRFVSQSFPFQLSIDCDCGVTGCPNKTCNAFANPEYDDCDGVRFDDTWAIDGFYVVPICAFCLKKLQDEVGHVFNKANEVFA